MPTTPLSVLLIEDEACDAELLHEAVVTCVLPWRLTHAPDVDAALAALDRIRPGLILSDRCLPGQRSAEVLARLQVDERTWGVPIVVLAGAMSDADRQACLDGQACAVLTKPDSFLGYLDLVQELHARWGSADADTPPETHLID